MVDIVESILTDVGIDVLSEYRRQLMEVGVDPDGQLSSTASFRIDTRGGSYELILELQDYWKYVERGRRSGKFPPPEAIHQWIRLRRIVPREVNGITPTDRQLGYLIGRKISREGIRARRPLGRAYDAIMDREMDMLYEVMRNEIIEVTRL